MMAWKSPLRVLKPGLLPYLQRYCVPVSHDAHGTVLLQTRKSSYSALVVQPTRSQMTIQRLRAMHRKGEPIAALTAQDFPSALVADQCGMDIVLVGDSLSMASLGMEDTTEYTMQEAIMHCRAVSRAVRCAFTVGDLPMGSYEVTPEQALASTIRIVKEGRLQAIKLEGGVEMCDKIRKITRAGIPVLGHIGLTPQRKNSLGGFRVQGKTSREATSILKDALAVQSAGCFATVLEAVPAEVAKLITERLSIPTIGIGGGNGCSGQVLVQNDLIGNFPPGHVLPKFVKSHCSVWDESASAIRTYRDEVKSRAFPGPDHGYHMKTEELETFVKLLDRDGSLHDDFALERKKNSISEE